MIKYLCIVFCFLTVCLKAQFGCSPSSLPGESFPPNSVNSSADTIFVQYLCGPNTVLYDTTVSFCKRVYVENNCTLFFTPQCAAIDHIWLKSTSVLTMHKNYVGNVYVHVEPGAIINQHANPQYYCHIDTCTTIVFPLVNCVTGIKDNSAEQHVTVYPNPTTGEFTIADDKEIKKIEISNVAGQVMFSELSSENKKRVHLKNFPEGIYFIKIFYENDRSVTRKLIVN